ncbi:MAG: 6-bladed beta-propeller [Dysgonamonadaceae bacterium]|nr:6-bladed beta-propeller [Dysgonamonadaceae bacterium]MDD3309869.1 6-bladed beta-propeller [Dysgonamonadaceae bacterium]MDD4399656.1 6-bladed beta-propeller [Dysgonamonadaceae bacterium]
MKKNIYTTLTIYLLLILLIITSCTTGSKKLTSKAVINDSIIAQIYLEKDIAQDKKISMDSLIEYMEYITPEFTNESMLSKYDKILFSEEYLFILENNVNNKAVFIFGLDGKYISKVNSIGQGPGE